MEIDGVLNINAGAGAGIGTTGSLSSANMYLVDDEPVWIDKGVGARLRELMDTHDVAILTYWNEDSAREILQAVGATLGVGREQEFCNLPVIVVDRISGWNRMMDLVGGGSEEFVMLDYAYAKVAAIVDDVRSGSEAGVWIDPEMTLDGVSAAMACLGDKVICGIQTSVQVGLDDGVMGYISDIAKMVDSAGTIDGRPDTHADSANTPTAGGVLMRRHGKSNFS
jgi:hypothetical protein